MDGATKTGVSVFLMDEGVDSGPVLLQRETDVRPDETYGELKARLSVIGAELLCDTFKRIRSLPSIPQDDTRATYAHKIEKAERLIDWSKPARNVVNLVRALSPRPLAYTHFRDKRVEIYRAKEEELKASPGRIIPQKRLLVGTSEGGVEILSLKVEGKSVMSGQDFINGYRPQEEDYFH